MRLVSADAAAAVRQLPILRLPTALFPAHPFTFSVKPPTDRRAVGALTPEIAHEIQHAYGRRLAVLADGANVGVASDVLPPSADSPVPTPSNMAHMIGGERLQLLSVDGTTAAGGRLGTFLAMSDDPVTTDDRRRARSNPRRALCPSSPLTPTLSTHRAGLKDEASAAIKLLRLGRIDLTLCTLDEELELTTCDPRSHPLWASMGAACPPPEEDAAALSLWLGSRLPLSTAVRRVPSARAAFPTPLKPASHLILHVTQVRVHLLGCTCPLKRLQDCVDAMRLLAEDGHGGSRYDPVRDGRLPKFEIVYDTAEASGCELEPPREIVDWARAEVM